MNAPLEAVPTATVAPLNVWLITVGEPLPLPGATARPWRTGLLANELVKRGHRVTWWTSTVDHFTKQFFTNASTTHPVNPRLQLQFLHGVLYRRNISLARWRNHRQIAAEFARLAPLRERPDVIVCSYPTIELSAAAVSFGRERNIPVLLDIRDLWPDEMAARLPGPLRFAAKGLLWPMYRDANYALGKATGLLAISGQYLAWGRKHGRRSQSAADAVFTHGYPDSDARCSSERAQAVRSELGIDPDRHILWFAGTFVGSIDLGTVIEAARLVEHELPLVFVLTGSGEKGAQWQAQAAGLRNVVFTGWVDKEKLAALAAIAWTGLAAYKAGALMSLTNKLFEYMAYGLPILLSLPGEARDIVEQANCGIFYEPGSADSLRDALRRLCSQSQLRDTLAKNARLAFEDRYSAASVYAGLTSHIENVAADRPAATR